MSEQLAFYKAEPTKYIVFTICAVILIQLLRKVFLEISAIEAVHGNTAKIYGSERYR